MSEQQIEVVIGNKKGLHARAAAKFVRTVELFNTPVMVAKVSGLGVVAGVEPAEVSGGSILGLMMLGAECGSKLRLRVDGGQADEITSALKKLIEEKFGEE